MRKKRFSACLLACRADADLWECVCVREVVVVVVMVMAICYQNYPAEPEWGGGERRRLYVVVVLVLLLL